MEVATKSSKGKEFLLGTQVPEPGIVLERFQLKTSDFRVTQVFPLFTAPSGVWVPVAYAHQPWVTTALSPRLKIPEWYHTGIIDIVE